MLQNHTPEVYESALKLLNLMRSILFAYSCWSILVVVYDKVYVYNVFFFFVGNKVSRLKN